MAARCAIARFEGVPEGLPLVRHPIVSAWHMHQPGERVDAVTLVPDAYAKHAYAVNWSGLRERTQDLERMPFVNMEVGRQVWNLRTLQDAERLCHVGDVVRALGGAYCVYGNGWIDTTGEPEEAERDRWAHRMTADPEAYAVPAYGRFSHAWAQSMVQGLERAASAARSDHRVCVVITPWLDDQGTDMSLDDWREVATGTANACAHYNAEPMLWWDGARVGDNGKLYRLSYDYAAPYVQVLAEAHENATG